MLKEELGRQIDVAKTVESGISPMTSTEISVVQTLWGEVWKPQNRDIERIHEQRLPPSGVGVNILHSFLSKFKLLTRKRTCIWYGSVEKLRIPNIIL